MQRCTQALLPALAALPLLLGQGSPNPGSAPAPPNLEAAQWTLSWDDSLDGDLETSPKSCEVRLNEIQGSITGGFAGPVLGEKRQAIFTGELTGGADSPLLVLQQREPSYTCAYTLQATEAGRWLGTWADTRGGAGTVELQCPEPSLPVRTTNHRLDILVF